MVIRRLHPGQKLASFVERSGIPPARIVVRVEYKTRSDLLADHLPDLGEGGLLLRSELDLAIDSRVTVELHGPLLDSPLQLDGVVRFKRGPEQSAFEHDRPTLGIELSRLDLEQQRAADRLESLLDQCAERSRRVPHVPD